MTADLPEAFEERMRLILGSEYEAFALSLRNERVQGLRFNTLKAPLEEEEDSCAAKFELRPVPWCREGFIYGGNLRPGKHPFHDAGVYYIQEPSAMAAVELMDVRPGEKVLDLCAAPGGKSTQIAAKLEGKGLLISNEIHPARVKVLSQNIERMGIRNAVVTQEEPAKLAEHFKDFFDKILVDAPCSGEGMFRKDDTAVSEWSEENVSRCAKRGQEILNAAVSMLKSGGTLLYSTCTFETEEDEGAIERLLNDHSELTLAAGADLPGSSRFCRCSLQDGPAAGAMYRLWPHRIEGEGSFMALIKKSGDDGDALPVRDKKKTGPQFLRDRDLISLISKECDEVFSKNVFESTAADRLILKGNSLYVVPEECPPLDGLKVIRSGLNIGTVKKDHFEPSHALALTVKAADCRRVLSLNADGDEIYRYLSGATLPIDPGKKGWMLICADEYSTGWGKAVNGVLKNHYPKGLRRAR